MPEQQDDANPNEEALQQAVQERDFDAAKRLFDTVPDLDPNCTDRHGTTPLQHAAFKGCVDICELLVEKGADVNKNDHDNSYSALMFGALSGNPDICSLLLRYGAKADQRNRIGRTASEMAAFTGQHRCVSVINNFIEMAELEYFTLPHQGVAPRLTPEQLPAMHKLVRLYNVHPVKILLFLREHAKLLLSNEKHLVDALDELMDRQMKAKETNEVMAFKLQIIYATVKRFVAFANSEETKALHDQSIDHKLVVFIKNLLATSKSENFPRNLEFFLRQAVKEFPYMESTLFQQILRQIAKTTPGEGMSAWQCIHSVLMGQRMLSDETFCVTCGDPNAVKRCSACKMANYCSAQCQKIHWTTHKIWCKSLAADMNRLSLQSKSTNSANKTETENLQEHLQREVFNTE